MQHFVAARSFQSLVCKSSLPRVFGLPVYRVSSLCWWTPLGLQLSLTFKRLLLVSLSPSHGGTVRVRDLLANYPFFPRAISARFQVYNAINVQAFYLMIDSRAAMKFICPLALIDSF